MLTVLPDTPVDNADVLVPVEPDTVLPVTFVDADV